MNGIKIGWAKQDITPDGPASLFGQYYERISTHVESPLSVTACAIESEGQDGQREQAIMISMDLLCPLQSLQDAVKSAIETRIPDFDKQKLFLNATHTHSAPDPGDPSYQKLLIERLSRAAVEAWHARKPAGISHALEYAAIGFNRRVQYADGTTEMYGSTKRPDFIGLEGPTDTAVNLLYCWEGEELSGVIINVPCPAQVTESKYYVSADFWSVFRQALESRFGREIFVLAQCGAAGDLSPRDLPRGYKPGEPNMWDISGMQAIGTKLFRVFELAYPRARAAIERKLEFKHKVKWINIPNRRVDDKEYLKALKVSREIHCREPDDPSSKETAWNRFLADVKKNEASKAYGPWDNKKSDYGIVRKKDAVIEQYRNQDKDPFYTMELHVIRFGEVAIASNAFELFVDFGFRIIARSPACHTLIAQLSCDYRDYLATERAIQGGGYSAMANPVGPEGGWYLVNETLNALEELWS